MAKKVFLIVNFLFLIFYIAIRLYTYNNLIFKKIVIEKEEFNSIISSKKEYKEDIELKLDGEVIPYDKVKNYYLISQIKDTKYNGNIHVDGFEVNVLNPTKDKEELIATNKGLTLLVYNDKFYKIIDLRFTYFPIIKLDNNSKQVIVYDNSIGRNTLSVSKEYVSYRIRGSSTSRGVKKSYKVNLLNSSGNNKKVSLLNMRKDDDWILNSMNYDRSYMLENIAYHIWQNMSEYNLELKYVELFIDNEYKGVYCLQEPADLKTFNANDNSLILQTKSWRTSVKEFTLFNKNLKYDELIDEFEFDSKIKEDKQIELARSFVSDTRNINYKNKMNLKYNLESMTDYTLFVNLISGVDNTYKNQKILFREEEGEYFVEIYPWDLDRSQNNEYLKDSLDFFKIFNNESVPTKISNSDEYNNLIKEKYFNLRKTIYNEEYLFSLIDNYKFELEKSGSILREESVWKDRDLDNSVKLLKDFYSKRIKQLDEYFGWK